MFIPRYPWSPLWLLLLLPRIVIVLPWPKRRKKPGGQEREDLVERGESKE